MTTEDKIDKKDVILNVAEELFAELGYDGASTRNIAKQANVNMAMLNYYFGGKEGLFKAVFERKVAGYRLNLQNLLNDKTKSHWDKIEKWVEMFTCNILSANNFQKIIYREITFSQRSAVSDHIVEMLCHNTNQVKEVIKDGVRKQIFNDIDVEMLIASIFGTKMYLINAAPLATKIFEKDFNDPEIIKGQIKPRFEAHILNMLKACLIKK